MSGQKLQPYFLLLLIVCASVLAYFIFRPFLEPFILAAVSSVVFRGLYSRCLAFFKNKEFIAAFVSTIVVLVVILVPLSFIFTQLFFESQQIYLSLSDQSVVDAVNHAELSLAKVVHLFVPDVSVIRFDVHEYLKQVLSWMVDNIGVLFSSLGKILVDLIIFTLSLFYLFKDGQKWGRAIVAMSPLDDKDDDSILNKLSVSIHSVIKGNLMISLLRGLSVAIGFLIFALPDAIFWSTITAIISLVPPIGSLIIPIIAVLYLFWSGHMLASIGLLLWSVLTIGWIDNFLGPKLVGRGMSMHPLTVLISVLGGIIYFGPIGVIFGPLVMSFLFVLLNIYKRSSVQA